jgi:hypothetical protein
VPELLEPLHQKPLETVGVDAIEVVSAKILVVALILLQVCLQRSPQIGHTNPVSREGILRVLRGTERAENVREIMFYVSFDGANTIPALTMAQLEASPFRWSASTVTAIGRQNKRCLTGPPGILARCQQWIPI